MTLQNGSVHVKGPKGELSARVHRTIGVDVKDAEILVSRKNEEKETRALHGLWRALIQNMVHGVTDRKSVV